MFNNKPNHGSKHNNNSAVLSPFPRGEQELHFGFYKLVQVNVTEWKALVEKPFALLCQINIENFILSFHF